VWITGLLVLRGIAKRVRDLQLLGSEVLKTLATRASLSLRITITLTRWRRGGIREITPSDHSKLLETEML
jgi:hypothetical protein